MNKSKNICPDCNKAIEGSSYYDPKDKKTRCEECNLKVPCQ